MTHTVAHAKPFLLQGKTEQALLLLHGFTASPSEVYPTARLIHEQIDCTVSGILLPGHGSRPELLNDCTWPDWYAAVKHETAHLQANFKQVFVGGLSMGALLALYAALHLEGVRGVVAMNAPIYNRNPFLISLAPLFGFFNPFYLKKDADMLDQLEVCGRFAYRVMPVRAFQSMMQLRAAVMREMQMLRVPALIIQSLQDESVHPRSGKYLYNRSKEHGAVLLELERSQHIATMGPEKERIAQEIVQFINRHG